MRLRSGAFSDGSAIRAVLPVRARTQIPVTSMERCTGRNPQFRPHL